MRRSAIFTLLLGHWNASSVFRAVLVSAHLGSPIRLRKGEIARKPSKGTAPKAAELAAREIDRLADRAATGEERASRKRRLIAGPKEFRGIRRK